MKEAEGRVGVKAPYSPTRSCTKSLRPTTHLSQCKTQSHSSHHRPLQRMLLTYHQQRASSAPSCCPPGSPVGSGPWAAPRVSPGSPTRCCSTHPAPKCLQWYKHSRLAMPSSARHTAPPTAGHYSWLCGSTSLCLVPPRTDAVIVVDLVVDDAILLVRPIEATDLSREARGDGQGTEV